MSENIVSLWPDEIRPEILSPMTILQAQAKALATQTGGVLLGEVKREEGEGNKVTLAFEFVVPALDNYRRRILNVVHDKDSAYPAVVDAEIFRSSTAHVIKTFLEENIGVSEGKFANRADSDQEFIEIFKKVIQSPPVLSSASSLIARANETLAGKEKIRSRIGSKENVIGGPRIGGKENVIGGKKRIEPRRK